MLICVPYYDESGGSGGGGSAGPAVAYSAITKSLIGPAALSMIYNGNADDSYIGTTVPFNLPILGGTFTQVFVGSNSYITFGQGSNAYSSLSGSNPPYPTLFISGSDNSFQRVYAGTEGNTFRIRFEGAASTGGTPGSPGMVWEVTFYSATPKIVDVVIGVNNRGAGGLTGVSTGTGTMLITQAGASFTSYRYTFTP